MAEKYWFSICLLRKKTANCSLSFSGGLLQVPVSPLSMHLIVKRRLKIFNGRCEPDVTVLLFVSSFQGKTWVISQWNTQSVPRRKKAGCSGGWERGRWYALLPVCSDARRKMYQRHLSYIFQRIIWDYLIHVCQITTFTGESLGLFFS